MKLKKLLALLLCATLTLSGCQVGAPANRIPPTDPQKNSSPSESLTNTAAPGSDIPGSSATEPSSPQTPKDGEDCSLPPLPTSLSRVYPTTPRPGYGELAPEPEPATQSWALAYESFYTGGPKEGFTLTEGYSIRENFVFPIYQTRNPYGWDGAIALMDVLREKGGTYIDEYLTPPVAYGVLLNEVGTTIFAGEGLIGPESSTSWYISQVTFYPVGAYHYRASMTITADIESQLLSLGFTPAGTSAKALWIPGYSDGVLFSQGELRAFLVSCDSVSTSDWIVPGVVYLLEDIIIDIGNHPDLFPAPEESSSSESQGDKVNPGTGKPVIYLYPEEETTATVKLDYPEPFTYTYPAYNDGWTVQAHPDGRLVNLADNREVYYLFWEGNAQVDWDFSQGFVVKGEDTETFLEEKLTYLGLTSREQGDFITYWAPEMVGNDYNLITFSTDQYEALAPLTVTPTPDSVLRVHMVYKPCTAGTKISPQTLTPGNREGFSVVEWGGSRAH